MIERSETKYPLALSYWEEQGYIKVTNSDGEDLILLPMAFLLKGQTGTFQFILEQLLACYECGDGHLLNASSEEVLGNEKIYSGKFTFTGTIFGPKAGPRFKYRARPPPESGETSTMSNSRRSSANQSRFREALCARDAKCLVTGAHFTRCTACHILPQSRPEYYSEVLGYDPGYLFLASFGLLLADDVHHAFDRGELGFYQRDEDIIIHMFCPSDLDWKQYHGQVIKSDRFHTTEAEKPDRRLLLFHYQQCAMMRFRGFWVEASA